MLAFILTLTIYRDDAPADVYIIDYNQTGADCIAALTEHHYASPNAFLACEIDHADYSAIK